MKNKLYLSYFKHKKMIYSENIVYSASIVFIIFNNSQINIKDYCICGSNIGYKSLEDFVIFCETKAKNENYFIQSRASINCMQVIINKDGKVTKQRNIRKCWFLGNLEEFHEE